jgi:zinc protease
MFAKLMQTALAVTLMLSAPAWAALDIQHWRTPQGTPVYFVENHDIPMLDVAVDFAAGSARDPAGQAGLAALTQTLLDQGSQSLSERAIAQGLADVGAVLGGTFDQDRAGVALRTLANPAERDKAFAIFTAVLQSPRFPAAVFLRERTRMIAALKEAEADPGTLASQAFYRALYGRHPYAHPESGEPASVARLERQQVVDFYRRHYTAGNAVISLIGDLDRKTAEALASRLAAGLPAGPALPPIAAPRAGQPGVTRIAHPSVQSHVLLGQIGIARNDPDFFPLYVGNYVLGGGGFDSRLIEEVRQKRGYAYSAYSYFMPLAQPGPLQIGLQTRNEQVDDALNVARDTVARYVADGPTDAELTQAKNNLVGGFPLRIDSNKKILDYLRVIGFYQLPLDYLDVWTTKVEAVTREQIAAAFRKHVDPAGISVIIVGGQGR